MKKILFLGFCLLLFAMYFPYISEAAGIGAGPSPLVFRNILRGGYAEETITISNTYDVPVDINISVEGKIHGWLTFEYGNNFTIPADSNFKMQAILNVPDDIQIGRYGGNIIIRSKPHISSRDSSGTNLIFRTGIQMSGIVEITGEQNLDYEFSGAKVKDSEEGYPIELTVNGKNTGNVRVTPVFYIDIWNRDKTTLVKTLNFTGKEVLPTTDSVDKIEISSENLSISQYWMNITAKIGDKVFGNKLLTFDILEHGSLKLMGELLTIFNKPWASVNEIVRIDAVFKNTGELPTTAKFKAEVYGRSEPETIVAILESEEMHVPVGETVNLTTYFTAKKPDIYVVNGVVHYGGKITFSKQAIINVIVKETPIIIPFDIIITVIILIILIFLLFMFKNKYQGRTQITEIDKQSRINNEIKMLLRKAKNLHDKIQKYKK